MNKRPNVIYTGWFVDDARALTELFEPVHKNVLAHHSTIAFRPKGLQDITVGEKHRLKIIGRVMDDKADALLVENPKSTNEHPHITLSTIKGVPPTYANDMIATAKREFLLELFNEPTYIDVTEGYFDGERDVLE